MALDERTSRPLYRQVADELRVQIHQRELVPGGQLPTEARLMDRYGVSRNTVRLALGLLRTEGLVVTGQGRGSFVAELPADHPPRPAARIERVVQPGSADVLTDELTADDERDELTVTTVAASPALAARLGVPPGQRLLARHRLAVRHGEPSHVSDSFAAADLVAGSDVEQPGPLPAGLAVAFTELGHPLTRFDDEVAVRMPTPGEAQELRVASGVPLLTVQRTASDPDGRPVLAMTALLPGDRHVLRYGMAVALTDGAA